MQEIRFIVGKNIQSLRQQKGWTQQEMAAKLNYSDKSVSKWERGESLPDVAVLKQTADLFSVTLDYLVEEEHAPEPKAKEEVFALGKEKAYYIITATSMFLVAIISTLLFVILKMVLPKTGYPWLCYAYGIPATMVVWLVFNSIWFNPRRNFGISSLLVWSLLAALYLTFSLMGYRIWPILLLGVPTQIIIWIWANLRKKERSS